MRAVNYIVVIFYTTTSNYLFASKARSMYDIIMLFLFKRNMHHAQNI